jgi:hypothetical protein
VVARSINKHPGSGVLFLDLLLRGTVLSRALLQTAPGEWRQADNSGDEIGLASWKFRIDADLLNVSVAAIDLLFQFSDYNGCLLELANSVQLCNKFSFSLSSVIRFIIRI